MWLPTPWGPSCPGPARSQLGSDSWPLPAVTSGRKSWGTCTALHGGRGTGVDCSVRPLPLLMSSAWGQPASAPALTPEPSVQPLPRTRDRPPSGVPPHSGQGQRRPGMRWEKRGAHEDMGDSASPLVLAQGGATPRRNPELGWGGRRGLSGLHPRGAAANQSSLPSRAQTPPP